MCDIVTVQPVGIVDHIIVVDDEETMRDMVSGDELGGSHPISSEEMEVLLSQCVGKIESKPGGSASNVIRNMARLGRTQCRIVGGRGDDAWGRLFQKSMEDAGIDVGYLFVKEGNTGCCCVVTCGNTRTMRPMFESAARIGVDDLDPSYFEGAKVLFVSAYCLYYTGFVERLVDMGKEQGCIIALDLASFEIVRKFSKEIVGILDKVDVCFCNEDEAREVSQLSSVSEGIDYVAQSAHYMLDCGVCLAVVVTLGEYGCRVFTSDGDEMCVPAYQVDHVVDTTGAGDAFSAGFLWGFLQRLQLVTCLEIGNLTGAAVVQSVGSEISDEKLLWLRKQM